MCVLGSRVDKLLKNAVQELLGTATSKITSTFSGEGTGDYFHDFEQPPPPAMLSSKSMPTLNVPPLEGDGSSKSIPVPIQGPAFSNLKNPVKRFKNMMLGRPTDVTAFEECSREFGPFSGPRNANDVKFRRNWRSADHLMNNRTSYHLMQRRSDGDGCDTISLNEDNIQEDHFIASEYRMLIMWDDAAAIKATSTHRSDLPPSSTNLGSPVGIKHTPFCVSGSIFKRVRQH